MFSTTKHSTKKSERGRSGTSVRSLYEVNAFVDVMSVCLSSGFIFEATQLTSNKYFRYTLSVLWLIVCWLLSARNTAFLKVVHHTRM